MHWNTSDISVNYHLVLEKVDVQNTKQHVIKNVWQEIKLHVHCLPLRSCI